MNASVTSREFILFINKEAENADDIECVEGESAMEKDILGNDEAAVKDEMEDEFENMDNIDAHQEEDLSASCSNNENTRDFSISFNDIVSNVRPFSGNTNFSIEMWIKEFEDFAKIVKLNDYQKLFFARNALKGPAKVFSDILYDVHEWDKFKELLLKEFLVKEIPVDVHKKLMKRKQLFNETLDDYILVMRYIGSRGNIDEESIIQYIIDGIEDLPANKAILYGAKTFTQFNEKVQFYKKITQIKSETYLHSSYPEKELDQGRVDLISGDISYSKQSIPNVNRSDSNHIYKPSKINNKLSPSKAPMKTVLINNFPVNALFDTGSVINIIKESLHVQIGSPKILPNFESYVGVGGGWIMPTGFVWAELIIDSETFNCKFYLVPDNLLIENVILGQEMLSENEVTLINGTLTIKKSNNIYADDLMKKRAVGVAMVNTYSKANKANRNLRNLTLLSGSAVPTFNIDDHVSKRKRDSRLATLTKRNSLNKRRGYVVSNRKKLYPALQNVCDALSKIGNNRKIANKLQHNIFKSNKGSKNINLTKKNAKMNKSKMSASKKAHAFPKNDKVNTNFKELILPICSRMPDYSLEKSNTYASERQKDSRLMIPEKLSLNKRSHKNDKMVAKRNRRKPILQKRYDSLSSLEIRSVNENDSLLSAIRRETLKNTKNKKNKNVSRKHIVVKSTVTRMYNLRKTKRVNYKGQC